MNLPDRLLELAKTLTDLEVKRPRQATLRRATSTAYYSVFHLLVCEYASLFSDDDTVRAAIGRTVNHKDITEVARDFCAASIKLPGALGKLGIAATAELVGVATAFTELQAERHDADYDLSLTYTRVEVAEFVALAQQAFKNWEIARKTPVAKIFLACFQLKKSWDVKR